MFDHVSLRTGRIDALVAFDGGAAFGRDAPVLWMGTSSSNRQAVMRAAPSEPRRPTRVLDANRNRLLG